MQTAWNNLFSGIWIYDTCIMLFLSFISKCVFLLQHQSHKQIIKIENPLNLIWDTLRSLAPTGALYVMMRHYWSTLCTATFSDFDHLCQYIWFLRFWAFMPVYIDWCWLMLIDSNWCRLMMIDVAWWWCWLMLIDADWCWLILIDADWCWSMLIDSNSFWLMLMLTPGDTHVGAYHRPPDGHF